MVNGEHTECAPQQVSWSSRGSRGLGTGRSSSTSRGIGGMGTSAVELCPRAFLAQTCRRCGHS